MYKHTTDIHNTNAAEIIIPFLLEHIKINSVLDIGTGIGTWLKIFKQKGVSDILGLDGDYVDKTLLAINQNDFRSVDLRESFDLKRKFDLIICLEVIEHIQKEFEIIFLNNIFTHSDLVLFSAAIPGQGGQNHFNEQWHNYWVTKFKENGYLVYDFIRPEFINNEIIDWWYRQNILLFSKNDIKPLKSVEYVNEYVCKELYLKKENDISNLHQKLHDLQILNHDIIDGKRGLVEPLVILYNAIKSKIFK